MPTPNTDERIAEGRLTLGGLIAALDVCDPELSVSTDTGVTFTDPHSDRGYYTDLALTPSRQPQTAGDLKNLLVSCLGTEFPGWKGGTFKMGHHTPLWLAAPGDTGPYLAAIGINVTRGLIIETAPENDD